MNQPKRGRRVLLLIALCFAAPVLISMVLVKLGWMPSGRKNYGELLDAPLPLAAVVQDNGQAFAWKTPPDWYWTLLVRVPADCAAVCRERLDLVANLRSGLGRNATKLRIAVVDPVAGNTALLATHGVYRIAQPVDDSVTRAIARPLAQPRLALVDPNGFVVLRYAEEADYSLVRKDLAKLLKQ